jgi:hypothetical protein
MTIIYDVWWRLIGLSFWVFGIWWVLFPNNVIRAYERLYNPTIRVRERIGPGAIRVTGILWLVLMVVFYFTAPR